MRQKQTFDAKLIKDGGTEAMRLYIPFDALAVFGSKNQFAIKGMIDKTPYRSSLFTLHDRTFMIVSNELRKTIGKGSGNTVHVTMEPDNTDRIVRLPKELSVAIEKEGLRSTFEKLSYTVRREHADAIMSAKKEETRAKRIEIILAFLRTKK